MAIEARAQPNDRVRSAAAAPSATGLNREIRLRKPRVTSRDRMFMIERLELLLETGIPLHSALQALERQASSSELARVMRELREGVGGGQTFAQALSRHPEAFPATFVQLVAAGEVGGFLPKVLARLRGMDEKREELRSTLVGAFAYPAFLVVVSLGVVIFVLAFVFPKFADIFEVIRDHLPVTTRLLMAASDGIRHHWALLLIGLVGSAALTSRWIRSGSGAEVLDRWSLRIPLLRDIAVQFQLVKLLHVLSLSLAHGVPLLDALRAGRETVAGASFRGLVTGLESRVSEGQDVAGGFKAASFLPPLVPEMIQTGEQSGSLGPVMARMAQFYEREWKRQLDLLARLIEPILLLFMGVGVGLVVSSMLLPIFKLSTVVG